MPDGEEVEVKVVEKTLLQQQLEKSAEALEKLILEGTEQITNIRVANDSREVDRREEEGVGREKIIAQLEDEANLATEMFNEISNKWNDILKDNDPLLIHEDMNQQKEKCEELIKQKDGIIAMLREEIREAERKFTNDQYKQNEDIRTLAKRIEKHIGLMRKAYRRERVFIESVIMEERKLLIEANEKKWEELYRKRDHEERTQCEKKFEQQEDFMQEMNKLRIEHEEKHRDSKIKLENEVEDLQREFERIKTMAIMNSEKLDYNYQILKKREDENLIINSQQKRRINKLQDVINGLRKKNQVYDEWTKNEIERLTKEVKKMQKCVVEIEHKAVSLSKINDVKYRQVWDLNIENANEVLNKILSIDRILHEQQLGLEWKKPDAQILKKKDLPSYQSGVEIVESAKKDKLKKEKEASETKHAESNARLLKDTPEYKNLLRHILQQIADKAGFLIEERLITILKPFMAEEKTLVTMDNVFTALGIKEHDDIDILAQFFLPYAKCTVCPRVTTVRNSIERLPDGTENFSEEWSSIGSVDLAEQHQELFDRMMGAVNQPDDVMSDIIKSVVSAEDHSESSSSADSVRSSYSCLPAVTKAEKTDKSSYRATRSKSLHALKLVCKNNHPLEINPVFVIRALREFITKFYVDTSGVECLASRLSQKHTTVSRVMTDVDVKMFWERYRNVFSEGKQRLWDGLFFGLQKYYALLKDRRKVNDEVLCLRKQNEELKHLLGKYAALKVKKPPCAEQRELPIQPTSLKSCGQKKFE
ncbi:nyd-sp28 protein [Holotrichia oblita]|uniref:Nyd-sp28 protein n=1 Tax=Holotrichia oblita TaxID=644536 RepID=A0ACB9SRF4_HOLOL|nr:nyd-sp28 protein [Holotrichia oblita]